MAGCSALGTHAACLAATTPSGVQKIKDRLPGLDLDRHDRAFWAVVSMHGEIRRDGDRSRWEIQGRDLLVNGAGVFETSRRR